MALADDMQRIVDITVREHQLTGKARILRMKAYGIDGDGVSQLAKACGASAELVRAWEDGRSQPTVNQALTWLNTLYQRQPGGGSG